MGFKAMIQDKIVSGVVFLAVLLFSGGIISASAQERLSGEPFTDPAKQIDMPEVWKKSPIKYAGWAEGADIAVTLDQHLYPALLPVIKKYAKEHNLDIAVQEGTCGISAGMLIDKTVDVGGFCCPPGETDRLPGLKFHTLGIASLALFVHPENPLNDISIEEARKVYRGYIYKWSELKFNKGTDLPNQIIRPVGRLHCKLRPGHWRLLLDNEDLFSPDLQEVGSIDDMIRSVSISKAAIGYETLWMVHRYREMGEVKLLKINGHSPYDSARLASGEYPLYRTYNITTWEGKGIANPKAQELVTHLLKEAGSLESKFGIVPASNLGRARWKFKENELVGEPE
jgi:ABC-type phosphate transport system substrate-binding protein